MASQGQRFRRKALRRGYKVDEVDAFLDRVEATLAGQPVGAPVASQEVHDVVFRVRFNGYDEWQVDLHLDRVERQLAELEERGGVVSRGTDSGMSDRLGAPNRMGPPMRDDRGSVPMHDDRGLAPMHDDRGLAPMHDDRGPVPMRGDRGPVPMRGDRGPVPMHDDRGPVPMRDDRGPVPMRGDRGPVPMHDDRGPVPMRDDRGPGPVPPRPMPAQAGPPADRYGRYDEPSGAFAAGGYDAPRGGYDTPRGPGGPGPMGPGGPGPMGPGGPGPGHGGPPQRGLPAGSGGHGPDGRFDGFEAGRHGRADMTAEIRMPERDLRELRGRGPAGPPSLPQQPFGGPPMGGPPPVGGPPVGGPPVGGPPPMAGPPMAGPPGSDLHRVDQIRRSFEVRRFGSGYDPEQVDRLFDGILGGMTGRGPMPVNPKDLDTLRFGLVPGGYFEAEVDAALKDVQDILFGR
ncbi:DivIVA domain-containing protein [Micromonospora rubida]